MKIHRERIIERSTVRLRFPIVSVLTCLLAIIAGLCCEASCSEGNKGRSGGRDCAYQDKTADHARGNDRTGEIGSLATERYLDSKGFFTVIPPAGWRTQEYPQEERGKAAFFGPETVELRVLVNSVDYDFEAFVSWCKDLEERLGTPMNIERMDFGGRPAIRRTYELKGIKFYAINFFVENTNHNLQYGAPPDIHGKYLPIVLKSMSTYEPILRDLSSEDARRLYLAKKLRIAQLMMEMENYKMAQKYIEEGLEASPTDPDLLSLKREIKSTLSKQ